MQVTCTHANEYMYVLYVVCNALGFCKCFTPHILTDTFEF